MANRKPVSDYKNKIRVRHISMVNQINPEGFYAWVGLNDSGDLEVYIDDPNITRDDIKFMLETAASDID